MVEQFANNASSTLNGGIDNVTTTIIVTNGSTFPATGEFRLFIGTDPLTAEIVLVTARTVNTLTVIRGQENTTAQSWADGTTVTHILTAGAVYTLQQTLRGKPLNSTLETVGVTQDGYALTWLNGDGYWAARPGSPFNISGNELNTTRTLSIDSTGTFASSRGDGLSKLYVNGTAQAVKFASGDLPLNVQRFAYVSDSFQTFTVPANITSLQVKVWGPGGGSGNYSSAGGAGPGGFSSGNLSVTPGETLYIVVGSGGKKPTSSNPGPGGLGGWPGGGFGTAGDASGGGGGGFSGIFSANSIAQANALIIAGGGGGSTGFGNFGAGGGGGTIGGSGSGTSGKGGTQSAGGADGNGNVAASTTIAVGSNGQSLPQATLNVASAASFPTSGVLLVTSSGGTQIVSYTGKTATTFTGCTGGTGILSTGNAVVYAIAGSAFTGGIASINRTTVQSNDCGGGGSGYFGGGAGQGDGRAGGGGSGFLHATRITSGVTTTGSSANNGTATTLPPNNNDPYYVSGIGVGGAASGTGNDGGDGYVVIIYGGQTSLDSSSLSLGNGTTISASNFDVVVKSDGYIKLQPGIVSNLFAQFNTDLIGLSSSTTGLKLDVNSATVGRIYQAGAWAIGDNATNNTSIAAQAGLTGSLINLASSTGSISSTTNQTTIYNQSGNLHLQGHADVRFVSGTATIGYFDSTITGANIPLRIGQNASTPTTQGGAAIPNNAYVLYGAGQSAWLAINATASSNRAAIEVFNSAAGTNLYNGISMQAAGSTHSFTDWQNHGIIAQYGASTSALIFSKFLQNGTGRGNTGRIYQTGAWVVGDATNNDTSAEAQAGLTGPLLNITQTTGGTLTTVANQALLYNAAGVVTLQGNSGHNFITGTTSIASTNANKFITSLGRRQGTTLVGTNVTVQDGYHNIFVPTLTTGITITLPASPTTGDTYLIKDRDGSASTFNIIISGNGRNIEQFSGAPAASLTLNQNYDAVTIIYNGTFWSII